MDLVIDPLGKHHDRTAFTCGQAELDDWFRRRASQDERRNVARVFVAMDNTLGLVGFYSPGFTRFLDDGRIDLSNNAAERALHGIALGRKSWLFAGSDRGGQRADVLARIADHPANKIDDLLPWNWKRARFAADNAA